MGRRRENPRRSSRAAAPRGALQGGAGADQIIEQDRRPIAHLADDQVASDDPAAAPFFDKGSRRLVVQLRGDGAAELLGALGAANVR